jgi:molecular chaperone DnaJ
MRAASMGGAFTINETCPTCRGRGIYVSDPCDACHGSGRALSDRAIQARIPAGVKDGQKIRLKGRGGKGENGGPPGDLFVVVKVSPHPVFGRTGDNLTITVPISFDEAALGADIAVPTLGGPKVTVKVPPGTPNGRTFRVRGKGAPGKDGTRGNLLVTVEVHVPASLSEDAKAAVEAYREATAGGELRGRLFEAGGAR